MHPGFPDWLQRAVPSPSTSRTKLSELRRVEGLYGDLDSLFDADELESVLGELTYTKADERANAANPSRLLIDGNIYNSLASYKSAVQKYARFRQGVETEMGHPALPHAGSDDPAAPAETERTFSLERDLQSALRRSIIQLEPGLTIIDGGSERSVPSGRIDILARDAQGQTVVIELKAVRAPRDAVAQVLAYMGDIMAESPDTPVRGILVAPEFDPRAVAAARVVPGLSLHSYAFSFSFKRLSTQ